MNTRSLDFSSHEVYKGFLSWTWPGCLWIYKGLEECKGISRVAAGFASDSVLICFLRVYAVKSHGINRIARTC